MSPHDLVFYAFAEPALDRLLRGIEKVLGTVAESALAAAQGQLLYACAEASDVPSFRRAGRAALGQLLHACAKAPDAPSFSRAGRAQEAFLDSMVELRWCTRVITLGARARAAAVRLGPRMELRIGEDRVGHRLPPTGSGMPASSDRTAFRAMGMGTDLAPVPTP